MWRQARDGLIGPGTRAAFLVSESVPETGAGLADAVLEELAEGLECTFGATVRRFIVDAEAPRIAWSDA
jgi:hypothetical protein